MKLKKTFNFYSDSGHGWLKVPLKMINKYCKDIDFNYSYMHGDHAFLEEDHDAVVFLDAYCNAHDLNRSKEFKFNEFYTNKRSKIRNYNSYTKPE